MENIEEIRAIKIEGIDEKRPPLILKAPYIDLYFKLSCKVSKDWCEGFHDAVKGQPHPIKVDNKEFQYIETYVRKSDEIVPLLKTLKELIQGCNDEFIAGIEARRAAKQAEYLAAKPEANAEQDALDKIVSVLDFT